jgi:UDP-glucuronate decarboxylase
MRYLIAGGAGFIGSNLVKRLLDAGEDVVVLDDHSTSKPENLRPVISHSKLIFKKIDITNPSLMEGISSYGFDYVINLACPASPIHYQRIPIKTMDTCYIGTKNLLEIAKKAKATFLQASTSEVYGDPAVHPQVEEYWGNVNTYGPRACYDEGKRAAEALICEYQRLGVKTRVIRIFNTYGPNMAVDDGRVVSNFICQALQNKDITIYGTGSQSRSFQYVDDLIDGLLLVLKGDYDKPINIGNPHEFCMMYLATEIIQLIPNTTSNIVFQSLPQDDPKQRCPDISKMKDLYGWEPKIQLKEGLLRTIEYFRTQLMLGK